MTTLEKIRAEIAEYGSIWVQYYIKGHTDTDIDKLVEDVLQQAKSQVLAIIDKYAEQEPCDDVVSREDAEQMFRNIRSHLKPQDYKSAEEFNTRDLMLLNAEQMIHALPSVRPQEQTGHWIFDEILDRHYYCSECMSMGVDYWDYCPNCGARMESDK